MQVKLALHNGITALATNLVQLPDLPGLVVQVWFVAFMVRSVSEATAVSFTLHHNIGTTAISVNDFGSMWTHGAGAYSGTANPGQIAIPFWPEPYELIGTQRWDAQPSAGTVSAILQIHYTLRRERNRTVWNMLRSRTSFESE